MLYAIFSQQYSQGDGVTFIRTSSGTGPLYFTNGTAKAYPPKYLTSGMAAARAYAPMHMATHMHMHTPHTPPFGTKCSPHAASCEKYAEFQDRQFEVSILHSRTPLSQ